MRSPDNPGFLVAFEGIDGSGKSTQAMRVALALLDLGLPVRLTSEPSTGSYGRTIRAMLASGRELPGEDELRLFMLDRAEHVERVIAPQCAQGQLVLTDRYYYSTAAYQADRVGLTPEQVVAMQERIAPRPDLVVLFNLEPKAAVERLSARTDDPAAEAFETVERLQRARQAFWRAVGTHPSVAVVDARRARSELTDELVRIVERAWHGAGEARARAT